MRYLLGILQIAARFGSSDRLIRGVLLCAATFVGACSSGDVPADPRLGSTSQRIAANGDSVALAAADGGDGGSRPALAATLSGFVVGRSDGQISSFLGIPYAEPPVGSLRWRAPAPHAPWLEPRDASAFGSPCPQFPSANPQFGSFPSVNEDCLSLNVWAPSHPEGLLPVMVFIHGGGFSGDTGSDPTYNGVNLASHGVVAVTINYRLGQLGFLAHPALIAEDFLRHSAGNYGFLDQQLALRWVQANIAFFGGNPANVTIFGQSAGAISVCGHVVAPSSAGLFRRAIQESGTCSIVTPLLDTPGQPYESAVSLGRAFASALGCDTAADVAACMRSHSVSDILSAAPRTFADEVATAAHYGPNVDGSIFPEPAAALLGEGRFNTRSWLGGANHDEGIGFALLRLELSPISTEADYESAINDLFPGYGSTLAALYSASVFGGVIPAYAFLLNDVANCSMRATAQLMAAHGATAYLYQFSRVSAYGAQTGLGAFHSAELPYVFGNPVAGFTSDATDAKVSAFMTGAWAQFASSGNPNLPSQPQWTPYQTALDDFMQIADTVSPQTGLSPQRCDLLSSIGKQLTDAETLVLNQRTY